MKQYNDDRARDFAGIAFIAILIGIIAAVSFGIGHAMDKPVSGIEVYPTVHSGAPTPGVPCWAVYNYSGVLVAYTAIASDTGILHEFNVHGGPVGYEPLPEPEYWFELDAVYSRGQP